MAFSARLALALAVAATLCIATTFAAVERSYDLRGLAAAPDSVNLGEKEIPRPPFPGWHYIGANPQQTGYINTTITSEWGFPWQYNTNSEIHGSAIVTRAGDRVYVMSSDHVLHALDVVPKVGYGLERALGFDQPKEAWRYSSKGSASSASSASPALSHDEKVLYVGTVDGRLVALNTGNGSVIWEYTAGGPVSSSVIHYKGAVYFGTQTTQFTSLNATTGEELWACNANAAIDGTASFSSDGSTVYFTSIDTYLYAVKTEGNQCHPIFGKAATCANAFHSGQLGCADWYLTPNKNSIGTSPVVDEENDQILVTTHGGETGGGLAGLYGIRHVDQFNNDIKTYFSLSTNIRTPATLLGNNLVLIGADDNYVYCLDITLAPARVVWKFDAGSAVASTLITDGESVVFGTVAGKVYSLDVTKGVQHWVRNLDGGVTAPPALANNGIVVIGTITGELYAIGAPDLLVLRIVLGICLLLLLVCLCVCLRNTVCKSWCKASSGSRAASTLAPTDGGEVDNGGDYHALAPENSVSETTPLTPNKK